MGEHFDRLFGIHFNTVQQQLENKGLDPSSTASHIVALQPVLRFLEADEIHRLILTASVLFYFLYHSQKATFPVDIQAIEAFVAKARTELEGVRSRFASLSCANQSYCLSHSFH